MPANGRWDLIRRLKVKHMPPLLSGNNSSHKMKYKYELWINKLLRQFLIIKPTRCTNFSNLFWNETLHVSDSSSVNHQEFFTLNIAMIYVIHVCWQLANRIRMELSSILILLESCQQNCMKYIIAGSTVTNSWWCTEELSETFWV